MNNVPPALEDAVCFKILFKSMSVEPTNREQAHEQLTVHAAKMNNVSPALENAVCSKIL